MKHLWIFVLVGMLLINGVSAGFTTTVSANGGSLINYQASVIENAFGNPIRFNGTTNGTYTATASTSAALTIGRSGLERVSELDTSVANSIITDTLLKTTGSVNAFDTVGMMNSESAKPGNLCDENDMSMYGETDSTSRYPTNQYVEGYTGIMAGGGGEIVAYKSASKLVDTDVMLGAEAQLPHSYDGLSGRMYVDAIKGFDQTCKLVNETVVNNTTMVNTVVCDTSADANLHVTTLAHSLLMGNESAYAQGLTSSIDYNWGGIDFKDSFNEMIESGTTNQTVNKTVNQTTNDEE